MTNDELIDKTNTIISELVYDKVELQKAYNYYNGVRDASQFRYLEENFGLGNPTSIEFTPLIKKHIDALIGEYLGTPIIPKVSCKDSETINNIGRDKQLKIVSEIHLLLTKSLNNSILSFVDKKNITDPLIEQSINTLVDNINNSFISEYEIAAQNVIEYIMLSRQTDMVTVLRDILLDLLVTGYTYYKVEPTQDLTNIKIKALSTLNTFVEEDYDSPYIKHSNRAVVRNWMTKAQILNKYGNRLSRDERKSLSDYFSVSDNASVYYMRHHAGTNGILAGEEVVIPGYPSHYGNITGDFIPVYEVEWVETDKNFVMLRYECIRIGEEIYIPLGKSENVIRSKDNPSYCTLSVNGVRFLNRGNKPYSLVLACSHMLDKYDVLNFYRDRLVANSGTTGDFVDISMLPTFLGNSMPERLLKFIAYKKGGIAPIDSSLPGRMESGLAAMTTIFNGFDDTLKAQAIQAIQIAIESVEQTVSSITGVFRERLNGIEARDAVTNIKIGQNNSFIITKQYYHQMDLIVNEILTDCLNLAKKVYKNGLTGTLILGDKYLKIFTALPEHFTLTDYDIRIITSSDVIKDLEYLRQMLPELVKSGLLAPDIIFEVMTTKSLSELKAKVKEAMKKQKEENNTIQQLQQKLQEMELLLKQTSDLLQLSLKKIEKLNESKMLLELQKMQLEYKVDWFKAETERNYRQEMAAEAKRRTEIELRLLYDGNPYNDTIRKLG